jgi:type VI protein secretion system component VasK
MTPRRWLAAAAAVVVFLAVSALLARWLGTENAERDAVLGVLQAQARGDVQALQRDVRCRDDACRERLRTNAQRLRARGDVTIVRIDSDTSHALGSRTGDTRVVWITPGRLTTVQCVLVRRTGTPLSGQSVTLLDLSAPIGRQSDCG